MIVWRGWGGLPVLAFMLAAFFGVALDSATGQAIPPWIENSGICVLAALFVAAFVWWRGPDAQRTVIDKASGREMVLRERHDLFWIPVRYWIWILLAFGALSAVSTWGR